MRRTLSPNRNSRGGDELPAAWENPAENPSRPEPGRREPPLLLSARVRQAVFRAVLISPLLFAVLKIRAVREPTVLIFGDVAIAAASSLEAPQALVALGSGLSRACTPETGRPDACGAFEERSITAMEVRACERRRARRDCGGEPAFLLIPFPFHVCMHTRSDFRTCTHTLRNPRAL